FEKDLKTLVDLKKIKTIENKFERASLKPILNIEQLLDRAGGFIGNGGNAVICEKRTVSLDIAEGEASSLIPQLGDSTLDEFEKAELAIARVGAISPELGVRLLNELDLFKKSSEFLKDFKLTKIYDSKHKYLPKDCSKVRQIASHRDTVMPGEALYSIDANLWDRMDNNSKAALVLHEIIYRLAFLNGARDSVSVRSFVRLIVSGRISLVGARDYYQLMIATYLLPNVHSFVFQGYRLALTPRAFTSKDLHKADISDFAIETDIHGRIIGGAVLKGMGGKETVEVSFEELSLGSKHSLLPSTAEQAVDLPLIYFDSYGIPKKVRFNSGYRIPYSFMNEKIYFQTGSSGGFLYLDSIGLPTGGHILEGITLKLSGAKEPTTFDVVVFEGDHIRRVYSKEVVSDYPNKTKLLVNATIPGLVISVGDLYCHQEGTVIPMPGEVILTQDLKIDIVEMIKEEEAREDGNLLVLREIVEGRAVPCKD
ncbi:MAG: hypothetical protein AB7O96_02990, partial [Pseudobdellovibrionaceae bacterium]